MAPSGERFQAGYAPIHRIYEIVGIVATSSTGAWLLARLALGGALPVGYLFVAVLLGMLGADLVSGVVHWGFDTWGDLDTPVVGRLAIRTFRHHHVDPTAMLHHDFVETNGHNFMLALSLTLGGLWVLPAASATLSERVLALGLLAMAVFVALTSQIHKWAHSPAPPSLVRLLQRCRLLLSPEHHRVHHAASHTRSYCITLGWLDGVLDGLRSFRVLERVVERVTGRPPRRDA